MKITAISDLHGCFPELPGGDLLILAGDYTSNDSVPAWKHFFGWLDKQQYRKIVMIAGNHDNSCTSWALSSDDIYEIEGIERPPYDYLCDSGTEFEGLKIWGSPWTLKFPGMNPKCMAFTCDTEEQLADKWALIPHDVDILVTHSPPHKIRDRNIHNHPCGSASLYGFLKYAARPFLHVFGHIHEAYGQRETFSCRDNKVMISVNASHVNERYQPVNKPIEIEL